MEFARTVRTQIMTPVDTAFAVDATDAGIRRKLALDCSHMCLARLPVSSDL